MSKQKLKNQFNISEWTGAVGDLGMLLPLAFALVIFTDFPIQRLFLLWGLVYLITGFYFKVPVAVQPLKAMAAIAIAGGMSADLITTSAFFFGIILLILNFVGVIRWLRKWFSPVLVRGIQVGIGLILGKKALELLLRGKLFLGGQNSSPILVFGLFLLTIILFWFFKIQKTIPLVLIVIVIGIGFAFIGGLPFPKSITKAGLLTLTLPKIDLFFNGLILLIIPQLPLTLGNAVYAASDICHTLWNKRSLRISPTNLAHSIGLHNIALGLTGGFPICHGSGGMAAHAQFGGKTGGTTVIIGTILVLLALIVPLSGVLFYIPIPLLSSMLAITSISMILLLRKLESLIDTYMALVIALVALLSKNFFLAMMAGLVMEQSVVFIRRIKRKSFSKVK